MEDYKELRPEDLVEDPSFRAWIYHGVGHDTWTAWINEHPDRAQAADLARNMLLGVRGEPDDLREPEIKDRVRHIVATIDTADPNIRSLPGSGKSNTRRTSWWPAAAVLAIALGVGTLLYTNHASAPRETAPVLAQAHRKDRPSYIEVRSGSENQKLVNLPDGSSVLLKRASSIRFPREFAAGKREVELSGEAFFEVKKNPEHPFFVYAGEMVTRVVGTSFTIRAYESDATAKVRVKTGKVSVSAAETTVNPSRETGVKELVLEPNQQAEFSRSDLKIVLLENKRAETAPIPIEQMSFEFRRTAVPDVFETIKTAYQVDIRYDAGLLAHCSITAVLGDEPLLEKLNMICEVIGATYHEKNGTIYIDARGCE